MTTQRSTDPADISSYTVLAAIAFNPRHFPTTLERLSSSTTETPGTFPTSAFMLRLLRWSSAKECNLYAPEGKWLIEGHGVDPDIVVDDLPHATFEGQDAQLEEAIRYLEKQIREDPRPVPKAPAYPHKSVWELDRFCTRVRPDGRIASSMVKYLSPLVPKWRLKEEARGWALWRMPHMKWAIQRLSAAEPGHRRYPEWPAGAEHRPTACRRCSKRMWPQPFSA